MLYKIKKAFLYLKHFGPREFVNHLRDRVAAQKVPYAAWYEKHKVTEKALAEQRAKQVPGGPKISVLVPLYCTPPVFLREMIDAVRAQSYENWELILADASGEADGAAEVAAIARAAQTEDARVRYTKLENNEGIAGNTNTAMSLASGDYFAFLDHDDLLAPDALYEMASAIKKSGADMLYSDEDKVDGKGTKHFQPHFKPAFNPDLLRSNNYITHLTLVKRELAEKIGPIDGSYEGAQDYDYMLRLVEQAERIEHVPRILYHWRTHEQSTADNPMSKQYAYEAGRRAIEAHLTRVGQAGAAECLPDHGFYRVRYPVQGEPLVSVIIPNKDMGEALIACVNALLASDYQNLEVLIVENNSTEEDTFALYEKLETNKKIRVLHYEGSFNYSAINNFAAAKAAGEYLLFLNNDVRTVIDKGWLSEMLSVCQRREVGAVGARLYYPDGRIQHAGIAIGIGGIAGALFVDLPKGRSGYMHKAILMQDLSAVTAACMMTKKTVFDEVGGFTEALAVAFNDVDFCLKLREKDYLVVYDPYVEAYHDESRTRGPEDSKEKLHRFEGEIEYMRARWTTILKEGDPYYNKNLSRKHWDYSLEA